MEKYKYHVTPTTHPHNAAIQLWLELGLIGLFIFLLLLCFSVQPLRRIPLPCLSIALAVAAGVIFTSLVSFGFWQETWLGIIGLLVICFKVVLQESNRTYS
jgi:O-antigen ligase